MPLNPIRYTENVVNGFLKYQMTAYALSDPHLNAQMRKQLSLEQTRRSPLLQGPYISLSRSFSQGARVADLIADGTFHPHMANLIPFPSVYQHQEQAIRSIVARKTTLVSTGTGSGKTETFLYPIISHCLKLRDQGAAPGITAVLVYPMNALAEDQLGRLRGLLAGSGISFGMYVGNTPDREANVADQRLSQGTGRQGYDAALRDAGPGKAVRPYEERCSREAMRTPGNQPRILLTNVKQLELLLTRRADLELFDNARLDFIVFDEAHTYRGALGAETACLIRRLRSYCGKGTGETTCIATSATIADPNGDANAGHSFASRFFGVNADDVELVVESYQQTEWARKLVMPPPIKDDPSKLLQDLLRALETDGYSETLSDVSEALMGRRLDPEHWQSELYDLMLASEFVFMLALYLTSPKALDETTNNLSIRTHRPLTDEELLTWLTLGAAAQKDGRPLLRPVVHGFVRGVGGAVVTFEQGSDRPTLYISPEQAKAQNMEEELFPLPLLTCTTCGQHYFEHRVQDFEFAGSVPGGGSPSNGHVSWKPASADKSGNRLLLLDTVIGADDDEDQTPNHSAPVYFCRSCGALHSSAEDRCSECGRAGSIVRLFAVKQDGDNPGKLQSCVACRAGGRNSSGRYREPARPVRATSVADVDVLAREMIRHAERKRLLVFADNRQDAAFQAGWMQDHARRFRLRSLMWDQIKKGAVSIGDLVALLDEVVDLDDTLSEALLPEVWDVHRKGDAPVQHAAERKYYLRIQVLREVTTSARQRFGLEVWGKARVEYWPLAISDTFVVDASQRSKMSPSDLLDGINTLLDQLRRKQIVWDPQGQIFSKFWLDGDREVQRGYFSPSKGGPKGIKLRREPEDDQNRVDQWIGVRGSSAALQSVKNWGISPEDAVGFIEGLWQYLVGSGVITPATLTTSRRKTLPKCRGTYQVNSDTIRIIPQDALWQCAKCRRVFARSTPRGVCPAFNCGGTIVAKAENPDDYDLSLLEDDNEMLRAREHSAQVPHAEREFLERMFKGGGKYVNTLVCTPTLEMGVDIGGLDSVLMRNVPPLASNYWQRTGRAGRRHRLAVNITYARPSSHDQYYYKDPLRMLEGIIEPPRFNMKNELMVRKHVHAAVLTRLYQLSRTGSGLSEEDRSEIENVLRNAFPPTINEYLFGSDGAVLAEPRDTSAVHTIVTKHLPDVLGHVTTTFNACWPIADIAAVSTSNLELMTLETSADLTRVVRTLKKRLDWALSQIRRLDEKRPILGTLTPDEDAQFTRCDRLVKRLKGVDRRSRRESEGHDDTLTYSVLAVEGFLPGYGLEAGAIAGTAIMPKHQTRLGDFDLPRPPAMALREYVPGNMIYANANKFVARYFHLSSGDDSSQRVSFIVDENAQAVTEVNQPGGVQGLGAKIVEAVPICDVDLTHFSHITDDEDYRFQLSVAVYGREQDRHGGGQAYRWGERDVLHRRNVHLRLVNVGPEQRVALSMCGYPLCLVCGQSVSPFSSATQLEKFKSDHRERCGRSVSDVGFYADIVADCFSIPNMSDRPEAYSVLETLRIAASRVLDMERDDLQIIVVGESGTAKVTGLLYDPMPGGSGLVTQICERFEEIVEAAIDIAGNCPACCDNRCVDCLANFRNAYYHRYLDRNLAYKKMMSWGSCLEPTNPIPPKMPAVTPEPSEMPVNTAEDRLKAQLAKASFPDPAWQYPIDLGHADGRTIPDAYYEDEDSRVCIYLDGLSKHIHGNPNTRERDRRIREKLRADGYDVIEIAASDLYDRLKMKQHFYRIGTILIGKQEARRIRDDDGWFEDVTD